MNKYTERAKAILADIREDDPKKIKAWEWVCRAYEARGFTIAHDEESKALVNKDGITIGNCAPLFEDLNAMREFELYIFDMWKHRETRFPESIYYEYYITLCELMRDSDDIRMVIYAPPDARLASWLAVMGL